MDSKVLYDSPPYYAETCAILIEPIQDPSPYARTFDIDKRNRPVLKSGCSAFRHGLGAGLIGITAMGITQTFEQLITGRPARGVPGEFILRFFGRFFGCKEISHYGGRRSVISTSKSKGKERERESLIKEDEEASAPSNLTESPSEDGESGSCANAAAKWAAYFGHGIVLGGFRGIMSYYGVRGFLSDMVFLGFTSSAGSYPFWAQMADNIPLSQLLLDSVPELIHQATYAFVTGFFCDHWVN